MGFELLQREALWNVLRAVPVVGLDRYDDRAFRQGPVSVNTQVFDEFGIIGRIHNPGATPDLETAPVDVVHQDQRHTIVGVEIADTQILAVAAKISVGEGAIVENSDEASRATPEL